MKQHRIALAARLLCLLLAICLLPHFAATAQGETRKTQDLALGEGLWFQSYAVLGDQVFLSGEKIWQWSPGQEELTELVEVHNQAWMDRYPGMNNVNLAAGDGKLYVFSADAGLLYDVVFTGGDLSLKNSRAFDASPLKDPNSEGEFVYYQSPAQTVVYNGRLYLVMRMYGNMGPELSLVSYDLAQGGAPVLHQANSIQQLAPYGEGKLLALVMDESHMYGGMGSKTAGPSLAVLDPATDTLAPLSDLELTWDYQGIALAHDMNSGHTYLAQGADIWRLGQDGKMEVCAYLNPGQGSGTPLPLLVPISGDRLLYINIRGIALRSANPEDLPTGRLSIYGSGGEEATHQRAIQKMNGISVVFTNPYAYGDTAQSLGQMLLGGEEIDIYFVASDTMDLANLIQKGYAADLSGNAGILAYLDSVYPMLAQEGLGKEGHAMMVPVGLNAQIMGYYPLLLEQTGLPVPKDYYQLVDMLETWQKDGLGDEYPNLIPLQSVDFFQNLLPLALHLYTGEMATTGQQFSFTDPLLTQMLTRADALRKPQAGGQNNEQAMQQMYEDLNKKASLIEGYYSLDPNSLTYGLRPDHSVTQVFENGMEIEVGNSAPLLLSIREGMDARLPLQVVYMAVNPKSRHLDQAIRYVEAYVTSLSPSTAIMLSPGLNEGIESQWLARSEENMAKYVAQLEDEIAKAEGAQKTQLERDLVQMKESHAQDMENSRWDISPQAIALYRSLMEKAYVSTYGELYLIVSLPDFQKLMARYIQGQLSLDQFLQEAEGKLRLIRLEGE